MQDHSDVHAAVSPEQPRGPMYPYRSGFEATLRSQGYSLASIDYRLCIVRALDQWMRRRGMGIEVFNEERGQQFLRDRHKRCSRQAADSAILHALLAFLREAKVVGPPVSQPEPSPIDRLQAGFAQHLVEQRGLRPRSVKQYLFHTRRFLSERFGNGEISLRELSSQDVVRCVLHQARTISRHAARCMAKALRSLLRFLHQRGDVATDLAASVPSVAYWSLGELPKYLTPDQIALVLKSCKQDNVAAQRDRTILLLPARLGLRACEVVRMRLEDINWEAGELTIRGKGGRIDKLPLPKDVGQSLAECLQRVRPRCVCRRVFIRAKAPQQGFSDSGAVDIVVQRALRRAGLNPPTRGAHLFRRGFATAMLRHGSSLAEIGKILRHHSPSATAIYAKVDLTMLRAPPNLGREARHERIAKSSSRLPHLTTGAWL